MSLRVALFGTSDIAGRHVAALRKAGAGVDGVYSRSRDRAEAFAAEHGLAWATDELDVVLGNDEVSGIVVVTEPTRHVDLATRALDAGKHVLVEKPLDFDLEKATAFGRHAARSPQCISVVSQYRFNPVLAELKAQVDEEAGGLRKMIHLGLLWGRDQEYFAAGTGWRAGGSDFFFNQGIHWLDVLNWFFGEPVEVRAISRAGRPGIDSIDRTVAALRYADGSLASLYGGSFADRDRPDQFVIHHDNGRVDYQQRLNAFSRGSRRWPWANKAPRPLPDLFELQARDFVDAATRGRRPTTTVEQAIAALRLSKILSGETGEGHDG